MKRDTGHPPPVIDTLLAATALDDLYFVTRNIRDVRHSGAALFNPWDDDPAAFPILPRPRHWRAPEV